MVQLDSEPPGADVTIDGMRVGRTPLQTRVSNRKDHVVEFQMSGAAPSTCLLTTDVEVGYVVLDVVFTFFVGVIVDAVTNGWKGLEQNRCFVRLEPEQGPAVLPGPVSMTSDHHGEGAL